jgi:flagellar protein FlgJ
MSGVGTSSLEGQFALEMQGLQRLKHTARQDPSAGAEEAAQQFEAMFIQMMVKAMRDAVPTTGLTDNKQTEMFREMLDKQWSQTMADRGIGLADKLVDELERRGQIGEASTASSAQASAGDEASLIAGIPRGTPRPLTNAIQPETSRAAEPPSGASTGGSFLGDVLGGAGDRQALGKPWMPQPGPTDGADQPGYVQAFVDRLEAPARSASRATGVPAELILAQAALETGWGRHEIPRDDGGNSYNVFGIKAGSQWQGETTRVATQEVVDGERTALRDAFRVYDSFEAAFTDYARLIGDTPRYAAVTTAREPAEAARALQAGGYATDPGYAEKLIGVMDSMGPLPPGRDIADNGSIGIGRL